MSEKKRKRQDEKDRDPPRKKVARNDRPEKVKISVLEDNDQWAPILASSPGLTLPSRISLKAYTKCRPNSSKSSTQDSELLLHSSEHPKLDYTAQEEHSNNSEKYLEHYIGVYDPENGSLQLVQARKAVVRSTLKSARVDDEEGDKTDNIPNALSARSNLGLAFGTKKSQKKIRALTANAIKASPSKSNPQGSPDKKPKLDPLAAAVVSSMAETTASMRTREELQAEIAEVKPIPKPDPDPQTPADAYPLERLVGGAHVLAAMGVKEWIDRISAKKDVQTASLFVSKRLVALVNGGDVKKLKILRYLYLLIRWFSGLKAGSKSMKKLPKIEDMGELTEAYGTEIVQGVGRRFADGFQLNKWHVDNMITHILALAITIEGFTMDVHDIREDLRLENTAIRKYYIELGCKVDNPTESEMEKRGIAKAEVRSHQFARLKIPLTFPKMRAFKAAKKM